MIPFWCGTFVGVPFKDRGRTREGWDCWGAVATIYEEVYGIRLPSFAIRYQTANDRVTVARLFFEESTSARWRRVDLKDARPPDVLAMSLAGARHVAVLVTPDRFLHVLAGRETCVERIHPHWAPRIEAVYRHEELVLAT